MARIIILIAVSIVTLAFLMIRQNPQKDDYAAEMMKEHRNDRPIANPESETKPDEPVSGETVTYATVDGNKIQGYLAKPTQAKGALPGIIVIHEWWGLNDNIRAMARRLAGEGYVALAVDLYNGKSAEKPEEAMKLVRKAMGNHDAGISNLKQAYQYLQDQYHVTKTGVIGWCFGGGWSLQTALALPDKINATVIYYGQLVTDPAQLKPLQMPIMGFFGGLDQSIPADTIHKFESVLNSLGKKVEVHIYPDANHAFANPSGTRYNPKAAQDAWKKTVAFFAENLK